MKIRIMILLLVVSISGCTKRDLTQYSDNTPKLDLFTYFAGKSKGWGIVQDRKGVLVRQFKVDISGELNPEGQLVLTEHFDWSDGEKSSRIWVLTQTDSHTVGGRAEDVLESAVGKVYGNVLNWRYRMNLEVDGRTWEVAFDDWMYLVSDEMLLNKATISKFGIDVAEVTIVFRKEAQ